MEPVTGIEPACPAWEAGALPLSYTGIARQIREQPLRGQDRHAPGSLTHRPEPQPTGRRPR